MEELGEQFEEPLRCERGGSRQTLEQHTSEREDVRARVHGALALRLLGRDVAQRSDQRARLGELGQVGRLADPGEAEIEHLGVFHPPVHEEDVPGLDVAMNDASRVHDAQRTAEARSHHQGLRDREPPARDEVSEILTLEPFHHEVPLARGHGAVGDVADDIGVPERGQQPRLALEARRGGGPQLGHHLDRHPAARGAIDGLEDVRHPPGAGEPRELVATAEHLARAHRLEVRTRVHVRCGHPARRARPAPIAGEVRRGGVRVHHGNRHW